jgi:hypothetical protein
MISLQDYLGTKEFLSPKPIIPERELLIATLDRAVLDYYGTNRDVREEAEIWLFGDSDPSEAFSFSWVCDHLGLEPGGLQRRIGRLSIPRNVSQAHRWLRSKVQSKDGLLERPSYTMRRAA